MISSAKSVAARQLLRRVEPHADYRDASLIKQRHYFCADAHSVLDRVLPICPGAPHITQHRVAHDNGRIYPHTVGLKSDNLFCRLNAAFISISGKAGHHLQYEVKSGGDTIGYAFKVTASGSQGNIVMIVGVDTDLTVTGVSIVNNSETKGIGSKVMDNEATSAGTGALDQFVGKSGAGTLVVKQNIDAVTGATVSTKGVTKGVNAALAAAEAMN